MNIKTIKRNTKVVSISLNPEAWAMLNEIKEKKGLTTTSVFTWLIKKESLASRLEELREIGRKTAGKFKITSEEDVYKIMGDV